MFWRSVEGASCGISLGYVRYLSTGQLQIKMLKTKLSDLDMSVHCSEWNKIGPPGPGGSTSEVSSGSNFLFIVLICHDSWVTTKLDWLHFCSAVLSSCVLPHFDKWNSSKALLPVVVRCVKGVQHLPSNHQIEMCSPYLLGTSWIGQWLLNTSVPSMLVR